MHTFLLGLGTGLSLILPIGAQNTFILKQGLKGQRVWLVCSFFALSDSILILLGIMGFSRFATAWPWFIPLAQYFGAVFLLAYAMRCLYSAFYFNHDLNASPTKQLPVKQVLMICMALTWLNPHVYLDTMVLLGSIAMQFQQDLYAFAAGAILASWLFFFVLGYGARVLLPLFQQPWSWKLLDVIVAMMMISIAIQLLGFWN